MSSIQNFPIHPYTNSGKFVGGRPDSKPHKRCSQNLQSKMPLMFTSNQLE